MAPRLRVFAGPNGSGKSTLVKYMRTSAAVNLYTIINADEIKVNLEQNGDYVLPHPTTLEELKRFVENSTRADESKQAFMESVIYVSEDRVLFNKKRITSYSAALLADFIIDQLLRQKESFSFETVFSHESKITLLKHAKALEYKVYLYFIATNSPFLNIGRVKDRVNKGGHDVEEEKVSMRYPRSLAQVLPALAYVDRAYFFDNSTDLLYLAEFNQSQHFIDYKGNPLKGLKTPLPNWFEKILCNFFQS